MHLINEYYTEIQYFILIAIIVVLFIKTYSTDKTIKIITKIITVDGEIQMSMNKRISIQDGRIAKLESIKYYEDQKKEPPQSPLKSRDKSKEHWRV